VTCSSKTARKASLICWRKKQEMMVSERSGPRSAPGVAGYSGPDLRSEMPRISRDLALEFWRLAETLALASQVVYGGTQAPAVLAR
jgi:hypothetical protein